MRCPWVRQKQAEALDPWLTAARQTVLAGFADGLKRDLAAVRAALSLPWSTGPVEGQISHLKTIVNAGVIFLTLGGVNFPRLGGR